MKTTPHDCAGACSCARSRPSHAARCSGTRRHGAVDPRVAQDVGALAAAGVRASIRDVADPHAPTAAEAEEMAELVSDMERRTLLDLAAGRPNPMLLLTGRPAFEHWGPLTKRAVALTNIYDPDAPCLGTGIDPAVYDEPLFDVGGGPRVSAADRLQAQLGRDRGDEIVGHYRRFVTTPIDPASRAIWKGTLDGRGVRTRAAAAGEVVASWAAQRDDLRPISMLSLACGAALPVLSMVADLERAGHAVRDLLLVDHDPMALATAHCFAANAGLAERARVLLTSLIAPDGRSARDLTDLVAPGSVDVVDLLGLFEYFPDELAVDVLARVRAVLGERGLVVFGNMIDRRPQQDFFTHVSLWPPLHQRSPAALVDLIEAAGFSRAGTEIVVPHEGVYALAAASPSVP